MNFCNTEYGRDKAVTNVTNSKNISHAYRVKHSIYEPNKNSLTTFQALD